VIPAMDFDRTVAPGGYAWWYLDALDPQGRFGLAIIGFVGSVFSPYYAHARRRSEAADPLEHCAINVGLYLPQRHCWSMTERGRSSVFRSPSLLAVGPSAMHWDGKGLRIDIDEICAPFPSRIRGTVRLYPQVSCDRDFALEPSGGHRWRPFAPLADVEVDLSSPQLRWRGTGYFDSNIGDTPLEQAFTNWQWTRAHLSGTHTAVAYDAQPRQGPQTALTLRFGRDGVAMTNCARPQTQLARSAWGLDRSVAVDEGTIPQIVRSLESGPFYARSLLRVNLQGSQTLAVHETLSLERFAAPWVQAMLPFRMPRAVWKAQPRVDAGAVPAR